MIAAGVERRRARRPASRPGCGRRAPSMPRAKSCACTASSRRTTAAGSALAGPSSAWASRRSRSRSAIRWRACAPVMPRDRRHARHGAAVAQSRPSSVSCSLRPAPSGRVHPGRAADSSLCFSAFDRPPASTASPVDSCRMATAATLLRVRGRELAVELLVVLSVVADRAATSGRGTPRRAARGSCACARARCGTSGRASAPSR